MIHLVVFDLDGTLVDSRRDLADATNQLIVHYGGQRLDQDRIVTMVGEGAEKLIRRAIEAAGLRRVPPDALAIWLRFYDAVLLRTTCPYPGMPEALQHLAARVPLAVLTNKPCDPSVKIVRGLGLSPYFREVIGGDGPWPKKPDPSGLQALMRQVDASATDTLLVGDSSVDLRTARAAGCRLCLARYGFGFARIAADELRGDDLIADTPAELPGIVTQADAAEERADGR